MYLRKDDVDPEFVAFNKMSFHRIGFLVYFRL